MLKRSFSVQFLLQRKKCRVSVTNSLPNRLFLNFKAPNADTGSADTLEARLRFR